MRRKQIYIEEGQERRLKEEAGRRGVPEAAIIREALDQYLVPEAGPAPLERPEDHPLWGIIGLVDDPHAPADVSLNHDHYLYGGPKKYHLNKAGEWVRVRPRGRVR